MFEEFDINGDGKITFEEFKTIILRINGNETEEKKQIKEEKNQIQDSS